ncbi:hypothetical protein [Dyella mobilis]|uniref:Uncharacterized protein n=1 Tax=Dyella mobilis TaxID=1849582 RepID=A0ABS2KEC6_9GAMM|nr:hypothetical protein [Dyella mobilis]MBM7129528.1 hypothetical protein [Dyella mobilis]GLQ98206.1 hypothetical protein GCM10007863_26260 [Dyella mobilis]
MENALILFALTKRGLGDLLAVARQSRTLIWVNHGIVDASELERLRADGIDLTHFTRWIDPFDREAVLVAVTTIREHHPDGAIFVESI